ncbi:MAG TPA: T9SS type A sorting domain-containing protein [Candidatus Kapabacteria bacterium]|nr:T9SS type A sorting domain-containing protein [Candidatus Kapabacteria bacterium]
MDNILYGAYGNNYYKSTDWGQSWSLFNEGLPISSFIHSMGGQIVTNGKVFVNLGAYYPANTSYPDFLKGMIFLSEKKDNKWIQKKLSLINGEFPSTSQVFFISEDTIAAWDSPFTDITDSKQGLFLSFDGGLTWERRMDSLIENARYSSLSCNGDTLSLFYLSMIDLKSHYLSSIDLGKTWIETKTPLSDSMFWGFNIKNGHSWIISTYTSHGWNIENSIDEGTSWQKVHFPGSPDSLIFNIWWTKKIGGRLFASMEVDYPNKIYIQRLYTSGDDGVTWKMLLEDSAYQFNPIFGKENYFITYLAGKGYIVTDSNFTNLTRLPMINGFGSYTTLLYASDTKLVAMQSTMWGGMDSVIISTDDGISWQQRPFFENMSLNGTVRWQKNINSEVFAIGRDKETLIESLLISSNDLDSWKKYSLPLKAGETTHQLIIKNDTLVLSLWGDSTFLYISLDKGLNWKKVITPQYTHRGGYMQIGLYRGWLYVMEEYAQSPYATSDLGNTWIPVSVLQLYSQYGPSPNYFTLPDAHIDDYWFYYFSDDHRLNYSTDLGSTWEIASGTPSRFNILPSLVDNNTLYAIGTNENTAAPLFDGRNAIYYSLDMGKSWQQTPGFFTDGTELFSNSKYFFVIGQTEIWRLPKSLARVPKNTSSIQQQIFFTSCYPNPATTEVHIGYSISKPSVLSLKAYDIMGRVVATLIDNSFAVTGNELIWDTKPLTEGAYILRLTSDQGATSKIVEVIK